MPMLYKAQISLFPSNTWVNSGELSFTSITLIITSVLMRLFPFPGDRTETGIVYAAPSSLSSSSVRNMSPGIVC